MCAEVLNTQQNVSHCVTIQSEKRSDHSGSGFFFFLFLPGWSRLTLKRRCDVSCLSDLLRTGLSQQLLCVVVGWELESESAAVAAPMVLGSVEKNKNTKPVCVFVSSEPVTWMLASECLDVCGSVEDR